MIKKIVIGGAAAALLVAGAASAAQLQADDQMMAGDIVQISGAKLADLNIETNRFSDSELGVGKIQFTIQNEDGTPAVGKYVEFGYYKNGKWAGYVGPDGKAATAAKYMTDTNGFVSIGLHASAGPVTEAETILASDLTGLAITVSDNYTK